MEEEKRSEETAEMHNSPTLLPSSMLQNADEMKFVSPSNSAGEHTPLRPYLLPKEDPRHIPPHLMLIQVEEQLAKVNAVLVELHNVDAAKHRDKAWETSATRVIIIMIFTYLTLSIYFAFVLKNDMPWLNAVVPTIGFNLSTWSIPCLKTFWLKFWYPQGAEEPRKIFKRNNN